MMWTALFSFSLEVSSWCMHILLFTKITPEKWGVTDRRNKWRTDGRTRRHVYYRPLGRMKQVHLTCQFEVSYYKNCQWHECNQNICPEMDTTNISLVILTRSLGQLVDQKSFVSMVMDIIMFYLYTDGKLSEVQNTHKPHRCDTQ